MKRQYMKSAIAAIAVIACVGFSSCMKDFENATPQGGADEANDFNFSTKKAMEFTLKYDVPAGYRVNFEMYSTSPLSLDGFKSYVKDSTLIPFLSGRADEMGTITFKGELPAAVSEIYCYSTAIGVPVLMKATVSDAGIVSPFEVATVRAKTEASATRAGSGASGTNSWKTYSVTLNKPVLPAVSMTISKEDKNLIDKSFPENQNYDIVTSYYRPSIQLNEKARVKIYSVKHGANSDRTNALAYFVAQNDNANPEDVNSNLQLLFPELTKTTPLEGDGYQLLNNGQEVFEAGSRIGFALFPDITPNQIVTSNAHLLYSWFNTGSWNTYSYPGIAGGDKGLQRASVPHMVMSLLRKDKDGHAIIALGFEDQPFSTTFGTNRGNFRDDIFIVEVDPASSLPDLPTPPTEVPDYDAVYTSSGVLSFEDCWPHAGDYDINDVTIAYERGLLISYKLGLVGMKEKFMFMNNGATFTNGFGYQLLGVPQSNITKCTVESDYKWSGQGLDATALPSESLVMLFDNGKSVGVGTVFNVTTFFTNGTAITGVNPFIVVKKDNVESILSKERVEVHLPTTAQNGMMKFLPTSKASILYWGQYEDKSNVKEQIYYVRKGNYPFALDINWDASKYGEMTNFMIPRENKSIDYSYPEFNKWVDSHGKKYTDWFLHPNPNM